MENVIEEIVLNDVQMSLLRMFNKKMSYQETVEIKNLLLKHYSEKLFEEVDRVVAQKILQMTTMKI